MCNKHTFLIVRAGIFEFALKESSTSAAHVTLGLLWFKLDHLLGFFLHLLVIMQTVVASTQSQTLAWSNLVDMPVMNIPSSVSIIFMGHCLLIAFQGFMIVSFVVKMVPLHNPSFFALVHLICRIHTCTCFKHDHVLVHTFDIIITQEEMTTEFENWKKSIENKINEFLNSQFKESVDIIYQNWTEIQRLTSLKNLECSTLSDIQQHTSSLVAQIVPQTLILDENLSLLVTHFSLNLPTKVSSENGDEKHYSTCSEILNRLVSSQAGNYASYRPIDI